MIGSVDVGTETNGKEPCVGNEIRSPFDSIAPDYDRWYDSPVNQSIDAIEKAAIKEALPAGSRKGLLLDVGCGTGHWLLFHRISGYRVVGLDLSPRMLEVAKAKFPSEIQLVRADAHRLPFEDRSFDVVCCITTLEFVSDRIQTLTEMWRCLKPGGRLVVGALNAFSLLGIKRTLLRSRTFRGAHLFTARELKRCLAGYGNSHVRTCAFTPPSALLLPFAPWFEGIGRVVSPGFGQFIVAWVQKSDAITGRAQSALGAAKHLSRIEGLHVHRKTVGNARGR
jgi:ubiquinone/menaquinone biosynthesis C-methylase UbiE